MEAILIIVMYFGAGIITSERVSSVDECKEIVMELRKQTDRHVSAYCIPAKKLEIVTPEQVMNERE